jgi:TonB family protein
MQPVPEQFTKAREIHGEERRLRVRRSPSALTYVTLGENNGGILANISETGLSVTAGEPLRENLFSRVSFELPQSDRVIESSAEVVWTSESKKEAGLRFVDMREETREQIRNWISPPGRNGKKVERPVESASNGEDRLRPAATTVNLPNIKPAEKSNERASDVESHDERKEAAPAAVPTETFATRGKTPIRPTENSGLSENGLLQRRAASGSGPKSWAFSAAQRAEFERLFPSEIRGTEPRETAAPEIAAQSEPVVERAPAPAPSFAPPIADSGQERVAVAAYEHRAAPPASAQRAADVVPEVADPARMWRAAPAIASPPRMPAQSLWDAPPPMLQPIIGGGFGSSYGAQAADSTDESRPRSVWSIAALAVLIVSACFALGFAKGPDLVGNWPMMEDVRQIVRDKLNHVETVVKNRDSAAPTASSNARAVTLSTSTSGQAVTPAQSPSSAPTVAAPTAPDTTAPPAGNAPPDAHGPSSNAAANNTAPDAASSDTASGDKAEKSSEANSTTSPAVTENPPASATKARGSEPSVSASRTPESRVPASRTPAKETPVEKPYRPPDVKAAPSVAVSAPPEAAPAPAAHTGESSTPTNSGSMPGSSTPGSSAPSGSTPAKVPSAPPVRAAAPAAHPATSPPSYFPVVAPAAGNVPRLVELPEEKVIDTAAVVIHSHQIVFVPAEPGPESSHKLEKLQIGDRTTKLAPAYPPQAAQKGMGGTVHLRAIIGKDGNVQDVRPINGPILLIPAAVAAIRQWQYRPTLLDQQPIEMQEDFTIEFRPLGVQAKQ